MSNDSRCYHYSATDYLFLKHLTDAPESTRKRFIPFICGVNINDLMAETYLRRLFDEFPGLIKGIGEIMSDMMTWLPIPTENLRGLTILP